jgi:hypothetical protein
MFRVKPVTLAADNHEVDKLLLYLDINVEQQSVNFVFDA